MEKTRIIRNGYVVDPANSFEGTADILIRDGRIEKVGPHLESGDPACDEIDASGMTVTPGLVDLHVHLRDPGQTYKEDVGTGAEAAAHGGVTTILAMPNTHPPMDSVNRIGYVVNKARTQALVHVHQASAITKDMQGEELVDIEAIARYGVRAFSEDGKSVMNAERMYEAMKRIRDTGAVICDHCEEITMVRGGVMNDDANAARLGLPGISNAVEDVITARDAILALSTGARLHLCHMSTAGAAEILRAAKKAGGHVTGEVCPHHFALTSDDIPGDDANFKMNPPLRTKKDVEALKEALADGTIDCISTDHAPHSREEKLRGFRRAPFGITGLETSAALTYTCLVRTGVLTLSQMVEKMSVNPARILGVPAGSLAEGMPADLAVFDFRTSHPVDPGTFLSKGKNTPFAGMDVYGTVKYTLADGEVVWRSRT